jgi:competence transcription factor ComK
MAQFKVVEVILYQVQDTDSYYGASYIVDACNTGRADRYDTGRISNLFASQKEADRQCEVINRIYNQGVKYGTKNGAKKDEVETY